MIPYMERYFDAVYTLVYSYCDLMTIVAVWVVVLGLCLWAFVRKRYTPICLWVFMTVSILYGAYRLAEFPIVLHPDEIKGGHELIRKSEEVEKPWLEMFHYARSHHKPYYNARPYIKTTLYCQVFYPCIKILGNNYITWRMVAVIFGTLEVAVMFLLLKSMFGLSGAICGSIFMVMSPWHLGISRTALPYSLTNFYSLLLLYLFWKGYYVPLAVFTAFSVTLYPTITVVYYFIVLYFLIILTFKQGWWKRVRKILMFMVFIAIVGQLFREQGVVIKDVFFYDQSSTIFQIEGIANTVTAVFKINFVKFFAFEKHNYIELYTRYNPVIVLLAILGIGNAIKNINKKVSVFWLLLMVIALSLDAFTRENHIPRRAIMTLAPMFGLAVMGLRSILPENKNLKWLIVALIMGIVMVTDYIGYFPMYDKCIETNKVYRAKQEEKLLRLE